VKRTGCRLSIPCRFNESVKVAQGLATFLNLVYLGLKGGWETLANKNGRTIKAAGTCGPGWGKACLFGS
jgi:hypothetical protein